MKQPSFSDAVVFQSALVRIGAFRCDRGYPGFHNTGPAHNDCFVFPRTAVAIEHEHAPPFVANPNVVTFYNRSQHYLRHEISERGDHCDWFGVNRELAREAARAVDPAVEDAPFRRPRGRCDSHTYLLQRRLFDSVIRGVISNAIAIEETVLLLLDRVVGAAAPTPSNAKRREVVHEVEFLLASRFDQPLTLPQIAKHTGTSVYHLCRTFREGTGFALHQYLHQLRIRHGLESVCETAFPLSRIAVDLGFAHHSHFTQAFRREFGVTPSDLRASRLRC
jgi:AraC family transcriptional regulator